MSYVIPNPPLVCSECMAERFQIPYIETETHREYRDSSNQYGPMRVLDRTDRVRQVAVYTCENGHVTRRPLSERHTTKARRW